MMQADLLVVLHDASNKWTRSCLSPKILRLLHFYKEKESVLVLNKVDLVREKRLLLKLSGQLTEGIVNGQVNLTTSSPTKTTRSKRKLTLEDLASSPPAIKTPAADDEQLTTDSTQEQPSSKLTESDVAKLIEGKIGWPRFSRVFQVSALSGDGVPDILVTSLKIKNPTWLIIN